MMKKRTAYTRFELIAVVMILVVVILAVIAIPRMSRNSAAAKARTCRTNIATIDTQIEAYYSENGFWPAALTNITNDPNYFPDGAPVCPVGGYYSIDSTTHRVSCSIHGR
jgi:type II secretory pathway pseudopilin PulG